MTSLRYYIDLNIFSLEKLRDRIKNFRLLPSQQILLDRIEEHFAILERSGIENLFQLQDVLKTKSKVQAYAEKTGLPVEYLTILRREVNSYQPKPINLKDFPGVNPETVQRLAENGIRTTLQLFPHVLTPEERKSFLEEMGIHVNDLMELTKLTDVARLKYVGPKFARLLIETEYDTVGKIAKSDYEELYRALIHANEESGIYKGKFGIEDVESWISIVVKEVPQVIEY